MDNKTPRLMLKNFDWPLAIMLLCLLVIGLIAVANSDLSAYTGSEEGIFAIMARVDMETVRNQALWVVTGLAVMAVVMAVDYKLMGELSAVIYWVNIGLLAILLFVAVGPSGMKGWFRITENRTFQPSEVAKVAIIITLAKHLSKRETPIRTVKELLPALGHISIPILLIILQPDVGTAMVYMSILLGMLFMSGISMKVFLGMIMTGALALVPAWFVIGDYRQKRILDFLDPSRDPTGTGYQVLHSKIAVGSGQMTGKGLFAEGGFSQLDFVPVKTSDFIFAVTAESVGFIGSLALVALFLFFLYRLLALSSGMQDRFGSLIIAGVTSMMLFHIVENIGMTIGLMPVTGIPLPFISYGGSAMWANLAAMGLVFNVCIRRGKKTQFGST